MSWITVIWSMSASACLTLAGIHLLIWLKQRRAWGSLLFSLSAAATSLIAACELWMMRSETTAQFGTALRWLHLPVWVMILTLVGFVRLYLRAGRAWLAWTICTLRTVSLALDFILTPNLDYREITTLRQVHLFGDSISVARGVSNPWMLIGQTSLLFLAAFVVDATITLWRRGDRRQALTLGSSMSFFVTLGTGQSVLLFWDVVHMPTTLSLFFMGIVFAMGYELSREALRAGQLDSDLIESEQRMAMAAEATNLGIWSRDLASNEIWATDKWRELFGFTQSERLELDGLLQRLHPEDREAVRHAPAQALERGGRYEAEYRVLLPDGRSRWIASRAALERASGGKPVRMRGVSLDITERKLAEVEAQQQRLELAHLSRVTMLGELSGSMAHELNQPLTAILSNAQAAQRFLAHDPVDLDEVREILVDIVEQDNRAGEIIRRLRLFLKKGEVQQQPLDINEVVEEVLKLIRSDLVNQGVATHTALAPALPTVNGDRVQLQQVLLNLVMNACDAVNGNAPAERRVIVRTESSGGEGVRVSVSDLGAGIASSHLEQVFEPFFTTKVHGLGLGLSVCRTIITAHGGKLWAANNPDRGASFHFTLPVSRGAGP